MSTIRVIYEKDPGFPATDQHPDAVRYRIFGKVVDAIGGQPTQAEVDAFLGLDTVSIKARSNAPIIAQIAVIEARAMRSMRELGRATVDATWSAANVAAIAAAKTNIMALDDQIATLRGTLQP